jgi:siderophore synthetase component
MFLDLQLWFKWPNAKEHAARRVVRNVVKKLIPQMFYEGRIQSVIDYRNHVLRKKIKRAQACQTYLTEEYMQVICCPLISLATTSKKENNVCFI